MDTTDRADAETKSAIASLVAATTVPKLEPMEATDVKANARSDPAADLMLEEEESVRRELELQLQNARRLKQLVAQPPKPLELPSLPDASASATASTSSGTCAY